MYDAILSIALENRDQIAIEFVTGEKVTYIELIALVDKCANALFFLDLKPGDVIAVILSNSIEYISLIIACAKCGIAYVPLLENFNDDYKNKAISIVNPKVLVTDFTLPLIKVNIPIINILSLFKNEEPFISKNHDSYTGIFRLLWSSGSTGFPKIIIWRQDKLLFERLRWIRNINITKNDIVFCRHTLDVAHATDLHVFTSLLSGATLIMCEGKESTTDIIYNIQKFKATVMSALPFHYKQYADCVTDTNIFSSMKKPFCGGTYVSSELMNYLYTKTGLKIMQLYGSTDFGLAMVNLNPIHENDLSMLILEGVDAYILPLTKDDNLIGELILKSPFTSEGYLNNDISNANTFIKGYYHTGDVARKENNGKYAILGRVSDVILTTIGPMLSPDIDVLLSDNTNKCQVISYVDINKTAKNFLHIAIYQPNNNFPNQYIEKMELTLKHWGIAYDIKFIDSIPRTPVGKIDKPKLFPLKEAI